MDRDRGKAEPAEGDMTRWNARPRVVCRVCQRELAPGGPTSRGAEALGGLCEDCATSTLAEA